MPVINIGRDGHEVKHSKFYNKHLHSKSISKNDENKGIASTLGKGAAQFNITFAKNFDEHLKNAVEFASKKIAEGVDAIFAQYIRYENSIGWADGQETSCLLLKGGDIQAEGKILFHMHPITEQTYEKEEKKAKLAEKVNESVSNHLPGKQSNNKKK